MGRPTRPHLSVPNASLVCPHVRALIAPRGRSPPTRESGLDGPQQTSRVRRERPDDTPTFVPNVDKALPLTTGTRTRTRDAGAVQKPHSQLCGRRM
jgi:hypothetical protein